MPERITREPPISNLGLAGAWIWIVGHIFADLGQYVRAYNPAAAHKRIEIMLDIGAAPKCFGRYLGVGAVLV